MSKRITTPFGYRYNRKKNKLVTDEEEQKVVVKIYALNTYEFNIDEIAELLNGNPLYKVIAKKILNIVSRIQEYNDELCKKIQTMNLENIIKSEKDINDIVKVLDKSKETTKEMEKSLIEDIDAIINILVNLKEISDIVAEISTLTKDKNVKKWENNIITSAESNEFE